MHLSKVGRPSPALLLAACALVFAMAGTAIAGPDAVSSAISKKKVKKIAKKQAKKQGKKQANKQISKREGQLNVNSAQTAVNADLLDGHHANSLVRSAFSQIDDNALVGPTGPANVRSTTIDAPTSGFLLVNAGSDVFGAGPDSLRCAVRVNGTIIASSEREIRISGGDNNSEEDCTTETTVPVPAGSHTVDLFAVDGVPAGIRYDEAELQVLFVPFGATGVQPASAAKSGSGGASDSNGN